MNKSLVGRFFRRVTCVFESPLISRLILGLFITLSTGCNRELGPKEAVSQLEKTLAAVGTHDALSLAIAAAKTNDFVVGVMALQQVKAIPGLTADQLMSVEQASQAMTADLVRRADAGDPQAKASLQAIAQTRSQ